MLQNRCSQDHIFEIESFISWREVGRYLPGIDRISMTDIECDCRTNTLRNATLLQLFQDKNGDDATYDALIDAMLKAEKSHEANRVCKLLEQHNMS